MKMERKLNKMYAGAIALMMVSIVFASVFATRTFTDANDTWTGTIVTSGNTDFKSGSYFNLSKKIWNSNGHVYNATGANLQLAINDLGQYGTVLVGSDITVATTISMNGKNGVVLDFQNNNVTMTANTVFLNMTNCYFTHVTNLHIITMAVQTADIFDIFGVNENNIINNILIHNGGTIAANYAGSGLWSWVNHNWTAFHILINDNAHTQVLNIYRNIRIDGCLNALYLQRTAGAGWSNGNIYSDWYVDKAKCMVNFSSTVSGGLYGFNRNSFSNMRMECTPYTQYGVKNINGKTNDFDECLIWDWDVTAALYTPTYMAGCVKYEWWIGAGARGAKITAQDYYPTAYRDDGYYTTFETSQLGRLSETSPYTYIVSKNASWTFVQNCSTGKICYRSTSFQNAMDQIFEYTAASNSTDKTPAVILIKKGTYTMTTGTNIGDPDIYDIIIMGEGRQTIIQCAAGGTFTSGMFYLSGAARNNITFRDLVFDGNNVEAMGLYVLETDSKIGVTVENCLFKGFTGATSYGIYTSTYPSSDTLTNLNVRNCEFYNNDYGILIEGDADSPMTWSDISHNFFTSNTNSISLDYCRNFTVSDNRIIGGTLGIRLDDTHNCTITGNIIRATNGIDEQGGADTNIIMCNNCGLCTTPIDINGAHSVHLNSNIGAVS